MSNWFIAAKKADFQKIAEQFHISPVLARLIRNRDVCGEEAIRRYLYGNREDLYDPYLLKDMDKAVAAIRAAIADGKKIRVIGDYDADGVCSTYILLRAFRSLGAEADYAIPHRMKDGFGLNDHLIEQAGKDGIGLIVTCDNGIGAAEQIALAYHLGIQVVVTDHHEVPFSVKEEEKEYHLPKAEAVVDPKQPGDSYPYAGICGAVVAYKLAQALQVDEALLDSLLEPAAFATVCDVMELQDENRILIKEGLKRMCHTSHAGLRALMEVNGIEKEKLDVYHIGFVLGPCINASGRLESAALSLALWLEEDYRKAVPIAAELKDLNESRKEMTEACVRQAVRILEENTDDKKVTYVSENKVIEEQNVNLRDKVLVLYLPDCHESLAGIVAGRIRERYHKPAIILTDAEDGVKGSGRSIEEYDMFAGLSACGELLDKFGGHKMAAGLSLQREKIGQLRYRLNENCSLTEADFIPKVHIDMALPFSYVTEEFIQELELLAPFGTGNRKPVFAQKEVRLLSGSIMGKNRNAARFKALDDRGNTQTLVYFGDVDALENFMKERRREDAERLFSGGRAEFLLTVTYYPRINEFRGKRSIEFVITDYC